MVAVAHVWDDELRAHKGDKRVDQHALAVDAHDAVLLGAACALVHEAVLVYPGDDWHVGHFVHSLDVHEQTLKGDVVQDAVHVDAQFAQRQSHGGVRPEGVFHDAFDLVEHALFSRVVVFDALPLGFEDVDVCRAAPLVILPNRRQQHPGRVCQGQNVSRTLVFFIMSRNDYIKKNPHFECSPLSSV